MFQLSPPSVNASGSSATVDVAMIPVLSTNTITASATVSQTMVSMSVPASGQQVTVCPGSLPIDRVSASSLSDLPPLDSSSAGSTFPSLSTIKVPRSLLSVMYPKVLGWYSW